MTLQPKLRPWLLTLMIVMISATPLILSTIPGSRNRDAAANISSSLYVSGGASSSIRIPTDVDYEPRGTLFRDYYFVPIYEPSLVSAMEAPLTDDQHILGVSLNGESRAYPITLLASREIVNDVVAGIPILATW